MAALCCLIPEELAGLSKQLCQLGSYLKVLRSDVSPTGPGAAKPSFRKSKDKEQKERKRGKQSFPRSNQLTVGKLPAITDQREAESQRLNLEEV